MFAIGLDHPLLARAWAAGIFSGEGSTVAPRAGYGVIVTVGNTNREMLESFAAVMGRGRIYTRKLQPGYKPAWVWKVSNRADSVICLDKMWDWLTEEKRDQARAALQANPTRRVGPLPGVPRGDRSTRPCQHCGEAFAPPLTPAQKYCSRACRNAARYQREYYGDLERQRELRKLYARRKRAEAKASHSTAPRRRG